MVIFALGWLPLYVVRTESLPEAFASYSPAERWAAVVSTVMVSVHVTAACITLSLERDVALWRAALSLITLAGGVAFWTWTRGMIGPLQERRLPDQPPLRLRRDGASGVVRNPLYLGVLIAASAPLFVVPRGYLLLSFALCFVALAVRALQDERRLHAQLGAEYEAYCREVKRLLPFVW